MSVRMCWIKEFLGSSVVGLCAFTARAKGWSLIEELRSCKLQVVATKEKNFSIKFSSSHVWMWKLDYKESWVPKNWCFWTVVLEKTLEHPLDCKEIQPVHPKGNQSWILIGRTDVEAETSIFCPHNVKNWLIWNDPDAGKDWGQEKGMTEDEMAGWHHWLNVHEFE